MLRDVYQNHETRSREGDGTARDWLERFLSLGERLGVRVVELRKRLQEAQKVPSVAEVVREAISRCRVPLATYRVQFTPTFPFTEACAQVDYLHELGISDLYASPILQARPGSQHGYDICDASGLNAELGTQADFDALDLQLKNHGMGLILDTVPNHMGVHHTNYWWMDVLENGPSSIYAACFDIDWDPVNPDLKNKVLLPVLEDQYGSVLEKGKIELTFNDGAFHFHHYEARLPVEPRSCGAILEYKLGELKESLGETDERVQELHSILTALSYLPPYVDSAPEKVLERNREKEVIKRRIASLAEACPPFRDAVDDSVRAFNGNVNDRASFDKLDRLLEVQPYRLAYWRVATEEINYRRFFDINDLAAIRVELPQVFQATHQLFLKLLAEGKANGLRIDHPDGLWDPAEYFRKLQESFLVERVRISLGNNPEPDDLESEVALLLEKGDNGKPAWPLYVVVEKILGDDEPLPGDWAVHGTTGYDFLNAVNGVFVDQAQRDAFDVIYRQFIRHSIPYADLIVHCQKMIMLVSMASEITALGHQLDRISERNRRYRDFTLTSLVFAIREIIATLPIYRTYINGRDAPSPRDRRFIEEAVEQAKDANPRTAAAIFDFIRDTLLLRNLEDFAEEDRPALIAWTMKFQQVTGPVLAKGLEDTAFYVYNRLASLNEVGGHPETFGATCADFHRHNQERLKQWPHAMLASGTHDTKRGEDMRARLNVLSELPQEWETALARWRQMNDGKKQLVENKPAPDRNDEYLLYQTLLGAWPPEGLTSQTLGEFRDRIAAYMQKAINEAKVHTSWVNPNQEYDKATRSFVERLLPDEMDDEFLEELRAFEQHLAYFGYINALSQVLLKLTSPGVPDFYQGSELWDFNLVDPDNRRPVDFARRRSYLRELRERVNESGGDLRPLAADLLATISDGKIKLYVIERVLGFRAAVPELFRAGSYEPLEARGEKAEHVCAFSRSDVDQAALIVVPRLLVRLAGAAETAPLGPGVWGQTLLTLPEGSGGDFVNLFTGEAMSTTDAGGQPGLVVADVLRHFPVALLRKSNP
ncbi:MAG: malto-oligosyltrehalose synthase [Planctomycetes bacterium]|nr:malto-oligosyltrehalose synthase [Planctomycetota bacterium]